MWLLPPLVSWALVAPAVLAHIFGSFLQRPVPVLHVFCNDKALPFEWQFGFWKLPEVRGANFFFSNNTVIEPYDSWG